MLTKLSAYTLGLVLCASANADIIAQPAAVVMNSIDNVTTVTTPVTTPATPPSNDSIQITRTSDAIYIKQAQRLTFDADQTAAAKNMTAFLQAQFDKLNTQYSAQLDPHGDLHAIKLAFGQFSTDLNDLMDMSTRLYGNVVNRPDGLGQTVGEALNPSGFVLFLSSEFDKNLVQVPFLAPAAQGGGSVTVAIVAVPVRTTRIALPQPGVARQEPVTYTDWDTSLVVIPTVNAGFGVATTGGGTNVRYGFGLLFGNVRGASDITGWTYGASVTADAPILSILPSYLKADGVNVKLLGVKNAEKTGAITNVLALVGLESGVVGSPKNGKVFNIDLESHFNISYIWDFTKFFASLSSTASKAVSHFTGQDSTVTTTTEIRQ